MCNYRVMIIGSQNQIPQFFQDAINGSDGNRRMVGLTRKWSITSINSGHTSRRHLGNERQNIQFVQNTDEWCYHPTRRNHDYRRHAAVAENQSVIKSRKNNEQGKVDGRTNDADEMFGVQGRHQQQTQRDNRKYSDESDESGLSNDTSESRLSHVSEAALSHESESGISTDEKGKPQFR